MKVKARYSAEPEDKRQFTDSFDRFYSRFARLYDWAVKLTPWWRRWLRQALPHIAGPRVLEVSFGTGWLLTQYAGRFETHGIDLNEAMVAVARRNLERGGAVAELRSGNVEALPYPDDAFDTVVNTIAQYAPNFRWRKFRLVPMTPSPAAWATSLWLSGQILSAQRCQLVCAA